MPHKDKYFYDANYTQEIRRVHGETYRGYDLIGRDMDVRGGVYYGKYGGEAIVVDPDSNPDIYWDYFKEISKQAREELGGVSWANILVATFDTVQARMRSVPKGVARLRRELEVADGDEIELGIFMDAGVAECRHKALACAALLEDFKEAGYIRGEISVDRNKRRNPDDENDRGGHAWVRYTSPNGTVFILDPAQNYLGTLEHSTKAARWNYLRPEEKAAKEMTRRELGAAALKSILGRIRRLTERG